MLCLHVWLEGRRLERSLGGGHRRPSRKARLHRKKKKKDLVLVFSNEKKQVSPADRGGGTLGAAGDRAPYVSAHQVRDVPRQRGARAGWVCLPKSLASGCSKELLSFFFLLFYFIYFFFFTAG